MKKFKGIVKNITHSIVVDGVTYTTPTYNVEYTCCFGDEGTFNHLICDEHKGVEIIPHKYTDCEMCVGRQFIKIINEAYPDKELMHLVCERFFRQYNEKDSLGAPRVLEMCGFVVKCFYGTLLKNDFEYILSEYDYYLTTRSGVLVELTPDCKDSLLYEDIIVIKKNIIKEIE